MAKVQTCPAPCPICKGNGRTLVLAENFDELNSWQKLSAHIGYDRPVCLQCNGNGTRHPNEPLGNYDPPPQNERN